MAHLHTMPTPRHAHLLRLNLAAVRAAYSTRHVAAHRDIGCCCSCNHLLEALQALCYAAVDVLLAEGFAGSTKDGNLISACC
jgi:hypothetical protein